MPNYRGVYSHLSVVLLYARLRLSITLTKDVNIVRSRHISSSLQAKEETLIPFLNMSHTLLQSSKTLVPYHIHHELQNLSPL
jgi:hypothetical protein